MENYLKILENSRNIIEELEANLQYVNKKITKAQKTSHKINSEYGDIVKRLEELNRLVSESEESLNNYATYGLIFIITILISFFLLKIIGLPAITYFLLAASLEGIGFFLKEHKIKKQYQALRTKNAAEIADEKEKLAALDEKRRDNEKQLHSSLEEKYALEEKIREEEEITSEILGLFAPLLDDLIREDGLSSSEYLDEAISRINKN